MDTWIWLATLVVYDLANNMNKETSDGVGDKPDLVSDLSQDPTPPFNHTQVLSNILSFRIALIEAQINSLSRHKILLQSLRESLPTTNTSTTQYNYITPTIPTLTNNPKFFLVDYKSYITNYPNFSATCTCQGGGNVLTPPVEEWVNGIRSELRKKHDITIGVIHDSINRLDVMSGSTFDFAFCRCSKYTSLGHIIELGYELMREIERRGVREYVCKERYRRLCWILSGYVEELR